MSLSVLEFMFRFLNLLLPYLSEQFIAFLIKEDKIFSKAEWFQALFLESSLNPESAPYRFINIDQLL